MKNIIRITALCLAMLLSVSMLASCSLFGKSMDKIVEKIEDLDEDEDADEDLNDYARLVDDYTNQKGGAETMEREPYVISPYDFGELDGYNQIELTYYADGTLEDEDYNVVTDVEELIGPKALTSFGEYEDDAVFVRNERLETDFQILKDYRTYKQARNVSPNRVDNE